MDSGHEWPLFLWIEFMMIAYCWCAPAFAAAPAVIGGTKQQQRFLACIVELTIEEMLPGQYSKEPPAIIILEPKKFLKMRDLFHAYRTERAFSILPARRIYLSSRVFEDADTALHFTAHELGHFVSGSPFEDNAELAAGRIRRRAREKCGASMRF